MTNIEVTGMVLVLIIIIQAIVIIMNKRGVVSQNERFREILQEQKDKFDLETETNTKIIEELKLKLQTRDFYLKALNKHAIFEKLSDRIYHIVKIKDSDDHEKLSLILTLIENNVTEMNQKLNEVEKEETSNEINDDDQNQILNVDESQDEDEKTQ